MRKIVILLISPMHCTAGWQWEMRWEILGGYFPREKNYKSEHSISCRHVVWCGDLVEGLGGASPVLAWQYRVVINTEQLWRSYRWWTSPLPPPTCFLYSQCWLVTYLWWWAILISIFRHDFELKYKYSVKININLILISCTLLLGSVQSFIKSWWKVNQSESNLIVTYLVHTKNIFLRHMYFS